MVTTGLIAGLSAMIIAQRIAELRLSARNESWARERGATEHGGSHYPLFVVLHTAWILAWPAEAMLRGPALASNWMLWAASFVMAEALRYWAIAALGPRWSTRVLVVPGQLPVRAGPYRVLRHPNYVAVALELAAVPLLFGAVWTAVGVTVLNAALLLGVRIPCENRALARGHGLKQRDES